MGYWDCSVLASDLFRQGHCRYGRCKLGRSDGLLTKVLSLMKRCLVFLGQSLRTQSLSDKKQSLLHAIDVVLLLLVLVVVVVVVVVVMVVLVVVVVVVVMAVLVVVGVVVVAILVVVIVVPLLVVVVFFVAMLIVVRIVVFICSSIHQARWVKINVVIHRRF